LVYDNGTKVILTSNTNITLAASQRMYIYLLTSFPLEGITTAYLKLNENNGTIAYDASDNSNNGLISGATWNNDGILITLTEGVGYTINLVTGTLTTISNSFSWLITTYTFSNIVQDFSGIITNLTGGASTFFTFANVWFTLLAIVLLIIIVVAVINVVSKDQRSGFPS